MRCAGFGDRFDGAEIGGGLVDQRLDEIEQFAPGPAIAGGHTRLDQHLQFPVASARCVILLRAFERMADLAETAVRPQPEIDPVTDAFRRVGREHLGQVGGLLKNSLLLSACRPSVSPSPE